MGHSSDFKIQVKIAETHEQIDKAVGGFLSGWRGKITLDIPPGALAKDAAVYFVPDDSDPDALLASIGISASKISYAYLIGADVPKLQKPARLTFFYDDADIAALDETKLALARVSPDKKSEILGGLVDIERNSIQTTITQFGTYALIENQAAAGGRPRLSDIQCQPRLFSPRGGGLSSTATISFNLSADGDVSVKIYNTAGRLVRKLIQNRSVPGWPDSR